MADPTVKCSLQSNARDKSTRKRRQKREKQKKEQQREQTQAQSQNFTRENYLTVVNQPTLVCSARKSISNPFISSNSNQCFFVFVASNNLQHV